MIVTFETEYGKIECDSEKKVAYFYAHDFESNISKDGIFADMFGKEFMVTFPVRLFHNEAILETWQRRTIGKVSV